jgi:hypothetical protein
MTKAQKTNTKRADELVIGDLVPSIFGPRKVVATRRTGADRISVTFRSPMRDGSLKRHSVIAEPAYLFDIEDH